MTVRDPAPELRCPGCGGSDVERSRQPHLGRWSCTDCWSWFNGSPDEWAKWKTAREYRQARQGEN